MQCFAVQAFAMMGIAAGGGGSVTVTDDDVIEKSNLSRQFLFRDWDIGRFDPAFCLGRNCLCGRWPCARSSADMLSKQAPHWLLIGSAVGPDLPWTRMLPH